MTLPTDSEERKNVPLYTGCMAYFPDALVEVARLSQFGNDKHNPGEPLHWSREKSGDHADCILRHQLEWNKMDEFGFYHAVPVAWRSLAQLQTLLEQVRTAGYWIRVDLDPNKQMHDAGMVKPWRSTP